MNVLCNTIFTRPYLLTKKTQQETLFYQIGAEEDQAQRLQNISELFTLIESNKEALNLETYSLSQTTLEQVFLSFARQQRMDDKL